jgi:hypothetical protein
MPSFRVWVGVTLAAAILISPFLIRSSKIEIIGEIKASSDWWDTSWANRAKIWIKNRTTTVLDNYQVKISIPYDNRMRTDFGDLRFVDNTNTLLLPYWIENYIGGVRATVWVKVPQIPASPDNTYIYMYFNNPNATRVDNARATFIFFDDFDDGDYTSNPAWTVTNGSWTAQNYYLRTLTSADHNCIYAVDSLNLPAGFVISGMFRSSVSSGSIDSAIGIAPTNTSLDPTTGFYAIYWQGGTTTYYKFRRWTGTAWVDVISQSWTVTANQWYKWEVGRNIDGSWWLYRDGSLIGSGADTTVPVENLKFVRLYGYGTYRDFDNIVIRKFVSPEPVAGLDWVLTIKYQSPSPYNEVTVRTKVGNVIYWDHNYGGGTVGKEYAGETLIFTDNYRSNWQSVRVGDNIYTVGESSDNAYTSGLKANLTIINVSTNTVLVNVRHPTTDDTNEFIGILLDGDNLIVGERSKGGLYAKSAPGWENGGGLWRIPISTAGDTSTWARIYQDPDNFEWARIVKWGGKYWAYLKYEKQNKFMSSQNLTDWTMVLDLRSGYGYTSYSQSGDIENTSNYLFFIYADNATNAVKMKRFDGENWIDFDLGISFNVSVRNRFQLFALDDNNILFFHSYGPIPPLTHDIYLLKPDGSKQLLFANQPGGIEHREGYWDGENYYYGGSFVSSSVGYIYELKYLGPWVVETKFKILWRTHDTDYESDDIAPTDVFADYCETRTVNPYTGSAWTWDEVNNLQIGARASALTGDDNIKVSEFWVEVVYTPPVYEWRLIETWSNNALSAPANWVAVDTWSGNVTAPANWREIDAWSGTVGAPAEWRNIETWSGDVNAPHVWKVVETWSGTVSAPIPAQWQIVESWTGDINTPVEWRTIEAWNVTLNAPAYWKEIEVWSAAVNVPANWWPIETGMGL